MILVHMQVCFFFFCAAELLCAVSVGGAVAAALVGEVFVLSFAEKHSQPAPVNLTFDVLDLRYVDDLLRCHTWIIDHRSLRWPATNSLEEKKSPHRTLLYL